ncbi:MAG: hypothetical protein R3338_15785, partial [Thermoanaerobaculia bacterium]|nr:hypothetical protein [Thermoanaerobaculia bacterium]
AGETSQLTVSATASKGSLQFSWYRGVSGDTSDPVPGGTSSTIDVAPEETTSYWVRVTDDCGSIDSFSIQVTVAVCEPVITQAPLGKVIGPGESTTLSVIAANATTYTWYVGASGNTSTLAGTGPDLTVSPSQTTSYWVRVGNGCGTVDSASVTVQVLGCTPPFITQQPSDVELQSGEKATLQVVASGSGPLAYQWYIGLSGDTSSPVGDDGSVLVLENVTSNTDVWVRVHDDCGFRDSYTATIRIVTVCHQPKIISQPVGVSIPRGQRAILQVEATGTSLIYQWSRRAGVVSLDVNGATGPVLETEPLEQDRIYYVQVRNNCGSVRSSEARVTVTDCSVPQIVSQTESQKLELGGSIELSVVVEGTGAFDYQWYEGGSGDVTLPIQGATGASLSVGPLSGSASFWARVSGECGTIDSETISLTVPSSRKRSASRP